MRSENWTSHKIIDVRPWSIVESCLVEFGLREIVWVGIRVSGTCFFTRAAVEVGLVLLRAQRNERPEHCVLFMVWLDRAVVVFVQSVFVYEVLLRFHGRVERLSADSIQVPLFEKWRVRNPAWFVWSVSGSAKRTSISPKHPLRFWFRNEGAAKPLCSFACDPSRSSLCPVWLSILPKEALIRWGKAALWSYLIWCSKFVESLVFLFTSILHF